MMKSTFATMALAAMTIGVGVAAPARAQNPTSAGDVLIEPPTLMALSFEWPISGDDNRTARVGIEYRKKGSQKWLRGLDLLRLRGEEIYTRGALDYTAPNMFTGSLFDLEAASDYEIKLTLQDADGVSSDPNVTANTLQTAGTPAVVSGSTNGGVGVIGRSGASSSSGASNAAGAGGSGNASSTAGSSTSGRASQSTLERIFTARTRAEPKPATGGRTFHVYPPGYTGPKQQPAFNGLLEAYFMASLGGDWSRASPPRVKAGDTILVHAGVYLSKHDHYSHEINSKFTTCCGTPWDGTYYLTQKGTPDRPIAIVGAGDGEVIFDGDNNTVLFNLMAGDYTYFEGVTFRNTGMAIEAGLKDIAGAKGIVVKHSRFEKVGVAVHSDWGGSANFYIADNDMLGRESLDYVFTWYGIKPWVDRPDFAEKGRMKSFYAVSIYGQGHVIAYNRVRGFHDGLDHATYGMPDNYPNTPRDRLPVSIDIYNNDVSVVHDNCFETDGAVRNIRVLRNRCFNAVLGAMSPQPIFGGPVYFIRNVVYNAWWGPVKIHGEPAGIYYLNNTYIGEFKQLTPASNMHLRNNLLMGQDTQPRVFSLDTFTNYSDSDYNGFRPNPGSKEAFAWNSPPFEEVRNYYPAHKAPDATNTTIPLVQRVFPTLAAYSKATGQDKHSRVVDYNVFVNAPEPNFSDPTHVVAVDAVDLTLRKGSAAIDAGTPLPNITEGYRGKAPDLGAYEFGEALPHYGPRSAPAGASTGPSAAR